MPLIKRRLTPGRRMLAHQSMDAADGGAGKGRNLGSQLPVHERQLDKHRAWNRRHQRSSITLQGAVAAFTMTIRRSRLQGPLLRLKKLMTGHAATFLLTIHQPQPAAKMQRHRHEDGEQALDHGTGHRNGGMAAGHHTFKHGLVRPVFPHACIVIRNPEAVLQCQAYCICL